MSQTKKNKYISLNAGETAVLQDTNTLLPRDEIYEPLAGLIREARDRANEAKDKSLNELRAHNAISIDGARGTGKTAVLVNLKRYLELEHKDLLADVHILEPIDPTLLENGESLFLHIIVAAVLHDEQIKLAQQKNPENARTLNQTLEKLAHTLGSVETKQERHGMDKVRAMYGNKQLADCVQKFFHAAVQLIGKKLLILPIDDVDTSLNLAFENLEIIRRYLTTPYVLPIVSGDRALYHDVTWRDFHGRLMKDSKYRPNSAYGTALELAEEYQRKVLPFSRRKIMPVVKSYWQWSYDRKEAGDKGVTLGSADNAMPLANFISWLEIFLTGPVNGQEDSRLPLPIPSIRALSQLVGHCQGFIPALPDAIRTAKSELEVRRIWQMPTVPLEVMAAFQAKHQELGKEKKREYGDAYKVFADTLQSLPAVDYSYGKVKQEGANKAAQKDLAKKLADYFRFETKAGAFYLVLLAKQYWSASNPQARQVSIFDTPLFQPLEHNESEFIVFEKTEDLSAWSDALAKRLPPAWLSNLNTQQTILPYPVAEVGINSSKNWDYAKEISLLTLDGLDDDKKNTATFLISLLVQHNFYTNAKQTMLLNIGRIFELMIISITGPVTQEDLHAIFNRAPFFSTRALAPTKTLLIDDEETKNTAEDQGKTINEGPEENPHHDLIAQLQADIEIWRKNHGVDQIDLSPWLVYKVFNKVYSQVASSEKFTTGMKHIGTALNMAAHTFYATWFAFGSFEKGALFGLPNVVATTNINSENLKNFEKNDHFIINVGPFVPTSQQIADKAILDAAIANETKVDKEIEDKAEPYKYRSKYGEATSTISYCLVDHPLKQWIDEVIKLEWPKPEPITVKTLSATTKEPVKVYLCKKLNLDPKKKLTLVVIKEAMDKWSLDKCNNLLNEMKAIYTDKSSQGTVNRGCRIFCVNGHHAGKYRLTRNDDDHT
jgi:hypothetical protein